MNTIDPSTSSLAQLWNRLASPAAGQPSPAATTAPTKPSEPQVTYEDALDRLPSAAVAAPVTLSGASGGAAAALDAYQRKTSGPYVVGGETVRAPAQFRMAEGYNQEAAFGSSPAARKTQAELDSVATALHMSGAVTSLRYGRGSPEALVKVTQALLDRDGIPREPAATLPQRIQAVQWHYGIGLDCAGYVYGAVAAVHGSPKALGLAQVGNENFTGLPQNPRFAKIDPASARTGDVLVLAGSGAPHDPGHNLVVYSHTLLREDAKLTVAHGAGDNADLDKVLHGTDASGALPEVHAYEVDSSFGAGPDGRAQGGVRRDLLVFNATTREWATVRSTDPVRITRGAVPYDEAGLTGFFRPKGAR